MLCIYESIQCEMKIILQMKGGYMSCIAEFGIIDQFEKDKDYSSCYEPEKYHCVAIDDNFLNDWWDRLSLIKTYFHCYDRPEFALARWSVTLIPPESLGAFYNIVSADRRSKSSKELMNLMVLLQKASSENKYVIHYGV